MALDLNRFSAKELKSLITQAKKQQAALSKRLSVSAVRKKLSDMAKAEGYTLPEIFGGKTATGPGRPAGSNATAKKTAKKAAAKKATKKTVKKAAAKKVAKKAATGRKAVKKVAPKYRNPDDANETWTGRGRKPLWMAAQIKKGKKPDDFLI